MADSGIIQEIIDYYTNLLIIQYNNKTKARAHIALFAAELFAEGVLLDIQNAYNLSDDNPAVGPQLDVLGKYAGVDRFYSELILTNYSAMITYSEVGSLPTSPPRFGLERYSTFAGDNDYNGTLQYSDIIAVNNMLNDAAFLTLIRFAIAVNNSNFSVKSISDILFEFFGTTVRREQGAGYSVVYFINTSVTPLIQAVIAKKLLPAPMGVGLNIVSGVSELIFGCTSYSDVVIGYESPYAHGFSTYSNYASLGGQTLSYSQITQG